MGVFLAYLNGVIMDYFSKAVELQQKTIKTLIDK